MQLIVKNYRIYRSSWRLEKLVHCCTEWTIWCILQGKHERLKTTVCLWTLKCPFCDINNNILYFIAFVNNIHYIYIIQKTVVKGSSLFLFTDNCWTYNGKSISLRLRLINACYDNIEANAERTSHEVGVKNRRKKHTLFSCFVIYMLLSFIHFICWVAPFSRKTKTITNTVNKSVCIYKLLFIVL